MQDEPLVDLSVEILLFMKVLMGSQVLVSYYLAQEEHCILFAEIFFEEDNGRVCIRFVLGSVLRMLFTNSGWMLSFDLPLSSCCVRQAATNLHSCCILVLMVVHWSRNFELSLPFCFYLGKKNLAICLGKTCSSQTDKVKGQN